ncbi:hypothetical protein M758_UG110700 [Ceratodon purpureus]|nr:hypothetical protein M758_UG110700 [Ceratodon purpureus]
MNLNLMTLNARGLNDPGKIDKLRLYMGSTKPTIDVLLVQEHKLRGQKAAELGRLIDRNAIFFYNEAEPGYGELDGIEGASKGGTAILINQRWSFQILASGSLFWGRALWVIFKDHPRGYLGVLNVYAPNDQSERRSFWQTLQEAIPRDVRWILGGGF